MDAWGLLATYGVQHALTYVPRKQNTLPPSPRAPPRAPQQGGQEVAGFANTVTGKDSNSSLNANNITAVATEHAGGAQSGATAKLLAPDNAAANDFTPSSDGSISTSLPPPPPYDVALSMPLSPKRYRPSTVTKVVPSTAALSALQPDPSPSAAARGTSTPPFDRTDTAHVSSSTSRYMPWASSLPGAHTKTTTTGSPLGADLATGDGAAAAADAAADDGAAAADAAERVLLGSPPPPPYEVVFSPAVDEASAEAPGGDSAALSMAVSKGASSSIVQDVAEDEAECVADVVLTTAAIEADNLGQEDGGVRDDGTNGRQDFTIPPGLDQGELHILHRIRDG